MFNRNGYASATLGQIAEAAGLTKGALYFHFASKDGLADAVQEQGHAVLRDFVRGQWTAGVPPVQGLIDMTHWLAWMLHEDWITEVLRLCDRAREAGELRDHTLTDGPETLLSAAVCGIGVLSGTGMPYAELRRRVGALWDSLLPALVPADQAERYDVHASVLTAGLVGAV
jgi:AcrR family transcriptional regulator